MHILFGGSDFDSRYMYIKKKKKKKDFRPTDPTLKFYPQKGNIFFLFGLMYYMYQVKKIKKT